MSKLGVMRIDNPLDIISASGTPKENPFAISNKSYLNNTRREQLGITNQTVLRGGLFGRSTPWDKNPLD